MTAKDKKTISELIDSLCSKNMRGPFLKALAESVGSSSNAAQKYFAKHGHLPAPTISDITKVMLTNPEVSKAMEMCPVGPGSVLAGISSPGCVEVFGTIPLDSSTTGGLVTGTVAATTSNTAKKRKKRNKKKKNPLESPELGLRSTDTPSHHHQQSMDGVLKPRNFLEAALYFSNITMGTVEMATDLEPEFFFAPPILFANSDENDSSLLADNTIEWIKSLKKTNCSLMEWEQHKAMQRRVTGLFSVALLQTTNPNVRIGDKSGVSSRSNYLKRTIGLYAISLVDHLPPTLCPGNESSGRGISTLSHFVPQQGASPLLLANRKVDLSDLKVPSALQLVQFWEALDTTERVSILRSEQAILQKGWISMKKSWCLCKYCRTRSIRLADIYEVLYRAYHDDLERLASILDPKRSKTAAQNNAIPPNEATSMALKPKTRRNLYRQLSELADDIIDERGYHYQMVMKRLGKAFEEDYDWGDCDHCDEPCEACRKRYPNIGNKARAKQQNCSELKDEYSDDEAMNSDEWDLEDYETFYEDFNLMEDEDVVQAENELPIDPAHLSTSFPQLYDPRLYTMPRPAVPAYNHNASEADRVVDGTALYQNFASLLFQFHLVPKYLESEALARQRRLIEEEEEEERKEKERAEQRLMARQRKREEKRLIKIKAEEEAAAAAKLAEEEAKLKEEEKRKQRMQAKEEKRLADLRRKELNKTEAVRVKESPKETIIKDDHKMSLHENKSEQEDDDEKTRSKNEKSIAEHVNVLQDLPELMTNQSTTESMSMDDEAPPGLLSASLSAPNVSVTLSGEMPPNIPKTWFDSILTGPIIDTTLKIWSPIAPTLKRFSTDNNTEMPPGFVPPSGSTPGWSPF